MIPQMMPRKMRRIREEKGMTKADLARKTKIQANMIAWIEDGRFFPYPSQLEKLSAALGVDGEILIEAITE